MAVTILNSPEPISLCGNPVKFSVQAEQYLVSDASYYEAEIGIGDGYNFEDLEAGDILTLTIGQATMHFTVTNSWQPNKNQLPLYMLPGNETYAQGMISFLQTNYLIAKYYNLSTVEGNPQIVRFTAKQYGYNYELFPSFQTYDNRPFAITNNQIATGTNVEYESNRFVRADIYIEKTYNSGEYTFFSFVENQIIDSDVVEFDLSGRLEVYLRDKHIFDSIGYNGIKRLDAINKRFFVEFSEYNGGEYIFVTEVIKSNIFRIHKGGIKKDEHTLFPNLVADYMVPQKMAPSWRPKRRFISPGAVDHLFLLKHYVIDSVVRCRVQFFFSNGETQVITDVTTASVNDYETFLWNVGHDRITAKANVPAGEHIVSYGCYWKASNDTDLCQPVYYTIVPGNHLDRYFYYENSFGVVELLKTNSTHEYGVDFNKNEQELSASGTFGSVRTSTKDYVEKFKGSTGNVTEKEATVLVDFLLSEKVCLKKGNRLIPIIIETKSADVIADDDYPFGFPFSYKRAEKQKYFSNLVTINFNNVDPGSGVDSGLTNG